MVLINLYISQMHKNVLEIAWFCGLEGFGAEAGEPLIRQKRMHLPFIYSCDYHIKSQIKFEAIEEKWIINIPLNYNLMMPFTWKFFEFSEEDNIVTLRS